jgi:hypothetical protein
MRTLLSTVLVRNPFLTKRQTPLDIPLPSYHIYLLLFALRYITEHL